MQRTAPGRAKRAVRARCVASGARTLRSPKKAYEGSFAAPGLPAVESILAAPE